MTKFRDIIGQQEVIHSLKTAVQNDRIGHAYIFSGPKGIGKRTVAGAFAGFLLCEDEDKLIRGDLCGNCHGCMMIESGAHPDLKIIRAEGTSIGVDMIREMQEDVLVKPMYGGRKVYIISEGDKMTVEAQNALLKTFEEPPPYVVILVAASNYQMLLPTILSRAIRMNLKKCGKEELLQALALHGATNDGDKEGAEYRDFIIAYADGIIGRALELAGSEDLHRLYESSIDLANKILGCDDNALMECCKLLSECRDSIFRVLDIMELWYRDLAVAGKLGEHGVLINSNKKDMIKEISSRFSFGTMAETIRIIEDTRKNLKQNVNYDIAIDGMLIRIQEACS